MTLSLTLLGGFQARLGSGGALSLPTRKTQALLAYLGIWPGHAHPRDKLAALLWSESSDERARDGLRHALAALRRAFPATMPPVLLVEGQTLVLSPAVVNVDVPTFERHAAEGTPEALEQAAAIYTGDLLSGFSLNEPLFEEWLVRERERLRELALDALAKLLVHQRSKQSADVALATALRLIQLDPLQEAGHRTLMRIYAQLGRRGAALRQYQLCVSVLQRELGVEPEEETKQLYHDVLGSGRRVDRLWVGGVPVAAPSPSTFRMPAVARDIPLVGREQEMARLGAVLNQAGRGEGHVVIVQGEGLARAGSSRNW